MRIVILGSGMSGLLAAHALRGLDHDITVIEAGNGPGGSFTGGGLKYLHSTGRMMELMEVLGIPFQTYVPRGGVLVGLFPQPWGNPQPKEGGLTDLEVGAIQRLHWLRTRGTPKGFRQSCMNDPRGPVQTALRCDHGAVIKALHERSVLGGVNFLFNERVKAIYSHNVELEDGSRVMFDRLVTTLPLPTMIKLMNPHWDGAPPTLRQTVVARLSRLPTFMVADKTPISWDYIYTPFDTLVTRVSRADTNGGGWEVEAPVVNGNVPTATDFAEHGWDVEPTTKVIAGHLVPLSARFPWPDKVIPVGRFAQWDSRATVDVVLDRVASLAEEYK